MNNHNKHAVKALQSMITATEADMRAMTFLSRDKEHGAEATVILAGLTSARDDAVALLADIEAKVKVANAAKLAELAPFTNPDLADIAAGLTEDNWSMFSTEGNKGVYGIAIQLVRDADEAKATNGAELLALRETYRRELADSNPDVYGEVFDTEPRESLADVIDAICEMKGWEKPWY